MSYCNNYYNCSGRAGAQPFPYSLVSRVPALPVSLNEVKDCLYIDRTITLDDELLTAFIEASIDMFENYTHTVLMHSVFTTPRNCWADYANYNYNKSAIELKRRPLVSVDEIKYNDTDDAEQIVDTDDYRGIDQYPWGSVFFNDTFDFPEVANFPSQITIEFTAGLFLTADDVPEGLKTGLCQYIAFLYNNRGDCSLQNNARCLPCVTRTQFNKYKIIEI